MFFGIIVGLDKTEGKMKIETERLVITQFRQNMAHDLHINSLDDDNRRFVPDEVFETEQDALDTINFLMQRYASEEGPFVYPILLRDGTFVGYVQAISLGERWEIGYHIGKAFTGKGYASEAVAAFLPQILDTLGATEILGVCLADNVASVKVMQKCGFEKVFDGVDGYQGEQRHVCKFVFRR